MRSINELLQIANGLDVRVAWATLGENAGRWVPDKRIIILDSHLTGQAEICTLAHELGHANHDHPAASAAGKASELEDQADRFAAHLLIEYDDYRAAERLVGPHPGALAEILGVDVQIVLAARWRLYCQ